MTTSQANAEALTVSEAADVISESNLYRNSLGSLIAGAPLMHSDDLRQRAASGEVLSASVNARAISPDMAATRRGTFRRPFGTAAMRPVIRAGA